MDKFLKLPRKERGLRIEQAAANLGQSPAVVEKDFWVCWTLRELFSQPLLGQHLLFKGGTSLSKGWGLIKRFSEDIDIVLDRRFIGFPGDYSLGNSQLKKLRKRCQTAVRERIAPFLRSRTTSIGESGELSVTLDDTDTDRQTILVVYTSEFIESTGYLRPSVKIELGSRSDTWPAETITVRSLLSDGLPGTLSVAEFDVRALLPRRTFWKKAFLIHEETFRPSGGGLKDRMARHYYDLYCLIRAGIAEEALMDTDLFGEVAQHRHVFFRQRWVDYGTFRTGHLRLIPEESRMAYWRDDYTAMEDYFFPGENPPAWESIITTIKAFEEKLNRHATG